MMDFVRLDHHPNENGKIKFMFQFITSYRLFMIVYTLLDWCWEKSKPVLPWFYRVLWEVSGSNFPNKTNPMITVLSTLW